MQMEAEEESHTHLYQKVETVRTARQSQIGCHYAHPESRLHSSAMLQ
jgi:hypothetical protein